MRIRLPQLQARGEDFEYRVLVDTKGSALPEALWYRVAPEYAAFIADNNDAALVALLIPAMARGEDITVEGAISERLFYHVSGRYQHLLRHLMPDLRLVEIRADALERRRETGQGVLTAFSGGIDSFSVLADHLGSSVPDGYRVTHLLYNNVGSHGRSGRRLFRERYARLAPFAERLGLPFIQVDSNLSSFYGGAFSFQRTHTPRNVSVALLLQRGIRRFLYAAAYCYPETVVGPGFDMAYADPLALPMLSSEGTEAMSVGGEYTRVGKTLRVAETLPESREALDVCAWAESAGNCSHCWKCLRTMLTLEIAGLLEGYAGVFDLATYHAHRNRFIGELLRSRAPLLQEIKAFARARGFRLPVRGRLYSLLPLETLRRFKYAWQETQVKDHSPPLLDAE